jgi:16S rRNA processing protein RimM
VNKDPYYKAGHILKTQGLKGGLSVSLFEPALFSTYVFETVFVDPGGGLVPYFVQSYSFLADKNQLTLHLDDIGDPAQASRLMNKDIFLASNSLPLAEGSDFYTDELEGFRVEDQVHGNLGLLEEVMELPMQRVFRIMEKEREILIPAVSEFIVKIDRANKLLLLKAPEGLIDIYLQKNPTREEEE